MSEKCDMCGGANAAALYLTLLCRKCATNAQVLVKTEADQTTVMLIINGHETQLASSLDNTHDSQAMIVRHAVSYRHRLADIVNGRATVDDPAFIADLPHYLAQVGTNAYVERVLDRQRANRNALSAVDQIIH